MKIVESLEAAGIPRKAALAYVTLLELGEATVQDIAKKAGIPRSSLYYVLKELTSRGLAAEVRRGKKRFLTYIEPSAVVRDAQATALSLGEIVPDLERIRMQSEMTPRMQFFTGPAGFRQAWRYILDGAAAHQSKSFDIITDADHFQAYADERYILREIISEKVKLGISSRQIVVDSRRARGFMTKDDTENRQTKLLPGEYPLAYTEVIAPHAVVFFSPPREHVFFAIEYPDYVKTRQAIFKALWDSI